MGGECAKLSIEMSPDVARRKLKKSQARAFIVQIVIDGARSGGDAWVLCCSRHAKRLAWQATMRARESWRFETLISVLVLDARTYDVVWASTMSSGGSRVRLFAEELGG